MKDFFLTLISTLFIFLGLANPEVVQGQFIHFQMRVEPEMSADVVQNLEFGEFISNSGTQRIEKGSSNMGIFEIRGLRNQNVAVTLEPPEKLLHTDPDISQQIPVSLEASYTTGSDQNAEQSQPFSGNNAWFTIGNQSSQSASNQAWQSAYVFIFGSITIGEVPDGTYEGQLLLTVEYQ